jgi:anti-anti-sigma factor
VIPRAAHRDHLTAVDALDAPVARCDIEIHREVDATIAALSGDLEAASAPDIERILGDELQTRPRALEISLEGLTFMDSSGLRMFLLLQRNAQRLGVTLRFVRPRGAVRRTLEFARALDYLGIES